MQSSLSWLRNCLIIAVARIPAGYGQQSVFTTCKVVPLFVLRGGAMPRPRCPHWRLVPGGGPGQVTTIAAAASVPRPPPSLPHTAMTSRSPLLASALVMALLAGSLERPRQPICAVGGQN